MVILPYRYPSPNVPLSAIRRYARQIAKRFHPDKILLFGSYAYGKPHVWSDVDILVVMPARSEARKSAEIMLALEAPFSLDLIVRTPRRLRQLLQDEDWFVREIMDKGLVLYESSHPSVGAKGGSRHHRRKASPPTRTHVA